MRVPLLLILGLAFFLLTTWCQAQGPGDGEVRQHVETLVSGVGHATDPGVAVLIKQGATVYIEKGYGVREFGKAVKIDSSTNFRLASVTKQFTAMAIMLLVHDGKLRYEDRLTDIWPEFPAYGKQITMRHLLTHTSGLPDYEELMEQVEKKSGPRWSAENQIQDAEVLQLLMQQTIGKFAPGTSWAYSTSAYVVLGLVIAKKSGTSYADFLERRIFAPVGMKHSMVYLKGKNKIAARAFGHSPLAKEANARAQLFAVDDQSATSATLGDGDIYSNLEDLSKWDDALQNHTLLSAKEMESALVPVRLADGSEPHWPEEADEDNLDPGKSVSYGFGWFLNPYHGHSRMWHTGSTEGFRNVIQRFCGDDLTIVILSNRSDVKVKALSEKIADLLLTQSSQ